MLRVDFVCIARGPAKWLDVEGLEEKARGRLSSQYHKISALQVEVLAALHLGTGASEAGGQSCVPSSVSWTGNFRWLAGPS